MRALVVYILLPHTTRVHPSAPHIYESISRLCIYVTALVLKYKGTIAQKKKSWNYNKPIQSETLFLHCCGTEWDIIGDSKWQFYCSLPTTTTAEQNGSNCVHLPPEYVRVPYDISESTERLGFDGENVHILTTPMTIMNICPLHINTSSDIFHRNNAWSFKNPVVSTIEILTRRFNDFKFKDWREFMWDKKSDSQETSIRYLRNKFGDTKLLQI